MAKYESVEEAEERRLIFEFATIIICLWAIASEGAFKPLAVPEDLADSFQMSGTTYGDS
jgi:hypothetical protein